MPWLEVGKPKGIYHIIGIAVVYRFTTSFMYNRNKLQKIKTNLILLL